MKLNNPSLSFNRCAMFSSNKNAKHLINKIKEIPRTVGDVVFRFVCFKKVLFLYFKNLVYQAMGNEMFYWDRCNVSLKQKHSICIFVVITLKFLNSFRFLLSNQNSKTSKECLVLVTSQLAVSLLL